MKSHYFQKSQLASLLSSVLLLAATSALGQNPVPSISTPLFPETLALGGLSFVLIIRAYGFITTSVRSGTARLCFLSPARVTIESRPT